MSFLLSNSNTTDTLSHNEDLTIIDGVIQTTDTSGGHGVETTGTDYSNMLVVAGSVYADDWGLSLLGNADGTITTESTSSYDVQITETGLVSGLSGGINLHGNNSTITNHGSVFGQVKMTSGNSVFNNTGLISAPTQEAVKLTTTSDDTNPEAWFANSGTITGHSGLLYNLNNSNPVDVTISNSGAITANEGSAVAVNAEIDTLSIVNTGTITAPIDAIYIYDHSFRTAADSTIELSNAGLIEGDISSNRGLYFVNTGEIRGEIYLGADDDWVVQNGWIEGEVDLDDGDDYFVAMQGSWVEGHIMGGAGNDRLEAGTHVFVTGFEETRMRGNLDLEYNGEVSDTTDAMIYGNRGSNAIYSGGGNDTIRGRRGDDLIEGGLGQDTMFGGRGDDSFIFSDVADSAVGATRDVIRNFNKHHDDIDLSELVTDELVFLSGKAFNGGGDAELRVKNKKGDWTIVQVDTDGDGATDMEIAVNVMGKLTEDAFIL